MIELTVLNYLKTSLGVDVYMEIPSNPPTKFVLIEKTGSGRENYIDNSTFAIQSYAGSLYDAATLNEQVKTALLGNGLSYDSGICGTGSVSRITLNSDYNATDTTNKKYRYQAVFDLVHF